MHSALGKPAPPPAPASPELAKAIQPGGDPCTFGQVTHHTVNRSQEPGHGLSSAAMSPEALHNASYAISGQTGKH
jgi:hypothetical protein